MLDESLKPSKGRDIVPKMTKVITEGTTIMKITKTHLARIIQEEVAAVNLQEAPLSADEYEEMVEYLWSQNLSSIVLPFKHATNLDGEFPPAIKTIVDYWEKKDFKGMASEWLDLRDELDDWLEKRGINWNLSWEEDDDDLYVNYSVDGKEGQTYRSVIDTNFKHAFRLIRMLIDNPPPQGHNYKGLSGMGEPGFMTRQAIKNDTLGRRPQQERKITKSALAQVVKEELAAMKTEGYGNYKRNDKKPKRGMKGLGESIAPYGDLEDYALEALQSLGGEQPVGDIAELALGEWTRSAGKIDYSNPRRPRRETVNEEEWFYSVKEAMDNLASQGRVRLTQGGPDDPRSEELYTLA